MPIVHKKYLKQSFRQKRKVNSTFPCKRMHVSVLTALQLRGWNAASHTGYFKPILCFVPSLNVFLLLSDVHYFSKAWQVDQFTMHCAFLIKNKNVKPFFSR